MAVDPQTILGWLRRLVSLDTSVFDEIKGNPTSTIPAVAMVALSMLLFGLGGWLWWTLQDYPDSGDVLFKSALFGSLLAIVVWHFAWLGVVYVVLTQFLRERVFLEQLLRVMGVAMSPLALGVLMFIPAVSLAVGIGALVLAFGLACIAVQRVTTADPARVLFANMLGFLLWSAVMTLLVSAENPYGPGVFLFDAPAEISSDFFEASDLLEP